MNKFKPIISNQEGQNLFPGLPTVIKGDNSNTSITMKNTKPQIAITPYGASYMTPGQDYDFIGNMVAELPVAQMGGQDANEDQIMQILQAYAEMKQIPIQQLMQQLQSLPEDQQQQALSAIVQDVQKTMQEQQMAQQQAPEEEMPMAKDGGCMDCQEQFPQAQNLNWFYKAQGGTAYMMDDLYEAGGEAFPQANPYPHMYADGGEAFPQAVNMNTFMGQPSNDFMFQKGGTLYDYVKSMGLDPSFQSRKKLFSSYFNEPYKGTAEQNLYLLNVLKSKGSNQKKPQNDKRQIPQTGVVVDKRTGNAVVLGSNLAYSFPVLTGENVDQNISLDYNSQKATPTGYYKLSKKNLQGQTVSNLNEFEGGYGQFLNPIAAYGETPPLAANLALHGTYLPEYDFRNERYGEESPMRNVSSGCINCKKSDYEKIFSNIAPNDTVLVLDTKKPKDLQLYQKAMMQSDEINSRANMASNYKMIVTDSPNVTGTGYEYGGTTDIDQAYQMMKRGGFDMNPKKKKGGKFTDESFQEYVMRNGGRLPVHQWQNSQIDNPFDKGMKWRQRNPFKKKNRNALNDYATVPYAGPNEPDEGEDFDQSRNDGFPTVTLDNQGNIVNPNQNTNNATQNQQQNNQSLFGPNSKSNVTVKQNQTMNPYGAYTMGRGFTNILGSRFGALSSIGNAIGATVNSPLFGGRSKFSYVDPTTGKRTRAKNNAADIAAAGMFGMLPNQQKQQQQVAALPQTGPNPNVFPYRMDQEDNPATFGKRQMGGGDFQYTTYEQGNNFAPAAYSAGVADQLSNNRIEELREQAYNRSAVSRFPSTTATKTIGNSPAGSINDRSFVPNTIESSFSPDAYMTAPFQNQQFTKYGGNILDQYEDGQEVDMSEMSPDEIRKFLVGIYEAGGSVEFL